MWRVVVVASTMEEESHVGFFVLSSPLFNFYCVKKMHLSSGLKDLYFTEQKGNSESEIHRGELPVRKRDKDTLRENGNKKKRKHTRVLARI